MRRPIPCRQDLGSRSSVGHVDEVDRGGKRAWRCFPQGNGQCRHFRADQQHVRHVCRDDRRREFGVIGIAACAQFLHRAQHCNPPPRRRCRQLRQGRLHRRGVGVVAFIDQQRAARSIAGWRHHTMACATPGQIGQFGQCQPGRAQIATDRGHGRHHRQRIDRPMRAGLRYGITQLALHTRSAAEFGCDQRAAGGRGQGIDQPHIGIGRSAEPDHPCRVLRGNACQQFDMRVVGRNDRGAAGLKPFENFRLGCSDCGLARKMPDMRGRDRGDHRHVGAHQPGQRGQFACMVHAHLEHAKPRACGHARQAQRHSDMVVVTFDRTVRLTTA